MRPFLKIIFRVLLVLVLVEFALTASGWVSLQVQARPVISGDQTMIVYGDSHTADLHNYQSTWPAELAKLTEITIVNLAQPSQTTEKILPRLQDDVNRYQPQYIAVMTGINDGENQLIERKYQLKTVKLLSYHVDRIAALFADKAPIEKNGPAPPSGTHGQVLEYYTGNNYPQFAIEYVENNQVIVDDSNVQYHLGKAHAMVGNSKKAEQHLKTALQLNAENYEARDEIIDLFIAQERWRDASNHTTFLETYILEKYGFRSSNDYAKQAIVAYHLQDYENAFLILGSIMQANEEAIEETYLFGEVYPKLNKSNDAIKLFKEVIEKHPKNHAAQTELAWMYLSQGLDRSGLDLLEQTSASGVQAHASSYKRIAEKYLAQEDFEKAAIFEAQATEISQDLRGSTNTYLQQIADQAVQAGAQVIIVQYPTLSVSQYASFSEKSGIRIVSNELIPMGSENYSEYFVDKAQDGFGHPTKHTNQLTAENVFAALAE